MLLSKWTQFMELMTMATCVIGYHKKTVYIGAFFGVDTETSNAWSSEALIPTVEMALDDVNNDSSVLKDYRLWYRWEDSKCDSGEGIRALLKLQESPPHKVAFLGPGCSSAAKGVGEALKYWKAVQIGYSISSPKFTNKKRFPRLFRTATSEAMENPARVALLKHFKWYRIALLVQNLDFFVMTKEDLLKDLAEANITLIASETFQDDPGSSLDYLKDKDARIIIALMYEDSFRKAMCAAYQRNLYGAKHVWMIVGWYNRDWWQVRDVTCTPEELKSAAGNMIETFPLPLSQDEASPTISGKTPRQLKESYERTIRSLNLTSNAYVAFTYDAAWTIALMLNKSIPELHARNKSLENLTYGDVKTADIFTRLLQKTDFKGMSGRVTFDKNGDRETLVQIIQVKGTERAVVGVFDVRENILNITPGAFKWDQEHPPVDGVNKIAKNFRVSASEDVIFLCLGASGIIFCLFCLMFNFYHRDNRYIKMSSPQFNNVTALGCTVCYLDVIVATYSLSYTGAGHRAFCLISSWMVPTGFTLAFGAMFAKTYRVYKIFTNNELKKELGRMSNKSLALRMLMFWTGNAIVLITWQLVDPLQSELVMMEEVKQIGREDTINIIYAPQCTSKYYNTWVIVLMAYQGTLLVFGMFLSWETRAVHITGLNDSKSIGVAVYNVFMFSVLAVAIEFFVSYKPTRLFFTRLAIYGCTTSTICLLFLPKIFYLKNSRCRVTSNDSGLTTQHTVQPSTPSKRVFVDSTLTQVE